MGAHLVNASLGEATEVYYWRERGHEVDFVIGRGERLTALEVKSGRAHVTSGLEAFRRRVPRARALVLGRGGIPLDEFMLAPLDEWLRS